ncbi:hypothetical protein TNIN_311381 [Trichonephila inaurata madagascariensis]|uniref:Uncharacterized protein n=1 Tax=Trichonephila inaurata madagascariensis TaxID=2747483 RepID=A0A8X6XC55_9ARAC|nr:hypothetical protein TNIN_311381 [Trichonephila inaurata madagascariensis]
MEFRLWLLGQVTSSKECMPINDLKNPEHFTDVTDDNADRFVETTNAKDTLHDSVDISIYQNIEANATEESEMP